MMKAGVPVKRVEWVAVKMLRAAVLRDETGVLRSFQWCRGWSHGDMLLLCRVVAGRAADVLAEAHGMPLGGGRWTVDEDLFARHRAAPERFAAAFLLAASNLDEVECGRLWEGQVAFARHVVGVRSGETTVIRSAVVAVVAQSAVVHIEQGVMP